ncbi:FKBP-type peptidyl-prolyl cis-trans isomerase [Mycobacterium sp. JS623]|uniref:FKBP-type peptidyl-prolyl cis-trans isomerase n=1 Tax=Mycobacterium sp. JS623 TaxID=212767 RepID=UPI001E58E4EB|nr:FKBP-type peptidyl-prolyl cis-trans isomerase [Mycobacterium sp. JS623]
MTFVNALRVSSVAVLACLTSLAVTLSGCGADKAAKETPSASASSSPVSDVFTPPASAQTPTGDGGCPSAAQTNAAPEWTLPGATGSVAVTGPTDSAAPRIQVTAPFSVTETQVHTLKPGDGPVVAATAKVFVCYMGVNGRDGSVFDSTYERGAPIDFSLDGVVPGFQKAIAGQKVGSTVAVAMTSTDGYPEGQPSAGIQPGDTLIFAIKILDASG